MHPCERIAVGNTLGECVLWDGATASLWWTDIDGCTLYRMAWPSLAVTQMPMPSRLASFGFVANSAKLVAAFDNGFALLEPATGLCGPLLVPEGLKEGMRLNDGRVDRQGRFWCGAMVMAAADPLEAKLYALQQGVLRTVLDGIGISNGIAFSPEGDRLYFADSRRRVIWRFAFDSATGTLGPREEFARIAGGAEPDGATVDADGCLWSALWGGHCVVRYTPDGRIDRVLEVPVRQPTCVTFGGPDLDLMFITSASLGLGEGPTGAGDVLVYNAGTKGLPESRFRIENWPPSSGEQRGA